ncbi:MAG: C39 family peptidase [Oscillospiraceae bacterium]|nr:C39 family peptidase [Oscillospiraceae bacterium]
MRFFTRKCAALLAACMLCGTAAACQKQPDKAVPAGPPVPLMASLPTEPEPTEPETAPTEPETRPPAPAEAMIEDVPFYSQRGLLPTGCELVSAKMVLEYYSGEEVPIDTVVEHTTCAYPEWKDGKGCAPHPERAFIGSPYDETSYGCFAPVIVEMMNQLLPEGYEAVDMTGADLQEMAETFIPEGTPVIMWATISMLNEFPWRSWYLLDENGEPTDDFYNWMALEHCLVLIGYDEENYYFNDPYRYGTPTSYKKSVVDERYTTMGRYCVIVEKKGDKEPLLARNRLDPDLTAEDPIPEPEIQETTEMTTETASAT